MRHSGSGTQWPQETIFPTFTQTNPAHVLAEIVQFAGKGKRLGEVMQ